MIVRNFNPRLHSLKVDNNKYIMITKIDVEEILGP